VIAILDQARAEKIDVQIVEGLGFVEPVLTALEVDGMAGLQVLDALDIANALHPPINPDGPALLGQLYSRDLASDVKLTLMNLYPDEHPVYLVHRAGTADEQIEPIPLYALDHSDHIAHLTSLYLPPLPVISGFSSFQDTIARLRGPDGCPWDRQQTHQSLAQGLIEETAEVLDALDTDDMEALCEELGDLLLHVVMQAQIATEEEEFTTADLIAGIDAKIRRRHPHVFVEGRRATGVKEVITAWNDIKRTERGPESSKSALDGVPASLSALAQAGGYSRKAAEAGFDWPPGDDLEVRIRAATSALLTTDAQDRQVTILGDLFFALVNWARRQGIDVDASLRLATGRFRDRFSLLENTLKTRAAQISDISKDELAAIWLQGSLD
jgi:tetrapyrrole methylase family protein/MazG family protein